MNRTLRFITVAVVTVASLVSFGAIADAGKPEKAVYLDLFYQPNVKPGRIFLTANSGPYIRQLHWKNWGTSKTVGRGRFISDCASCGPKENKPAVITMRGLKTCKAHNYRVYTHFKLHVIDPSKRRVLSFSSGCPPKGEGF